MSSFGKFEVDGGVLNFLQIRYILENVILKKQKLEGKVGGLQGLWILSCYKNLYDKTFRPFLLSSLRLIYD